jgi:sulfur carrier protein ThiS
MEVAEGVVNALDQYMPTVTLPRLNVAYDADGVPSLFGIKTTTLEALVGIDLSFLNLPPAYVTWFTNSNLQHVEVEVHEQGVFLYANGNALPYLAWDEASLDATGTLLDATDMIQYDSIIRRAVPLVRRLGLDLVLHFPAPAGADAIAVRPREQVAMAEAMPGEAEATVDVGIQYTSQGLPSVMGLTSRDLLPLGINLTFLELNEPTVNFLGAANLKSVGLETRSDGIVLSVNGEALPHVAYSEAHLENLIDLYSQLYGETLFTSFMKNLVPALQGTNVDVTVGLPAAVAAD